MILVAKNVNPSVKGLSETKLDISVPCDEIE